MECCRNHQNVANNNWITTKKKRNKQFNEEKLKLFDGLHCLTASSERPTEKKKTFYKLQVLENVYAIISTIFNYNFSFRMITKFIRRWWWNKCNHELNEINSIRKICNFLVFWVFHLIISHWKFSFLLAHF